MDTRKEQKEKRRQDIIYAALELFVLMAEAQRNMATPPHIREIAMQVSTIEQFVPIIEWGQQEGTKVSADYVVCACDTDFTFGALLPKQYMPKGLKKMYEERKAYPVSSGFQIAFAVDDVFPEITGTRVFSCADMEVGKQTVQAKSITVPGTIKGVDNVLLASQWLMGPGGLPTAAAMGKFAAWRIINNS